MKRATGTRLGPQNVAALAVMLVILAGCEEGFDLQPAETDDNATETAENSDKIELFPEATSGKQRDVEAPEVFQLSEAGLWDGRPSLGGIWVAHPDVNQPERVLIKNPSNNKTVTGALFRRERNLPGPALQVSSAAADKLGLTAGAPTRVEVVALRRETVAPKPAPEEPKPVETEVAEAEPAEATTPEAGSEEKPAKRKWWQKKPAAEVAAATAVAGAAAETADEAPKPVVEAAAAPEPAAAPAALSDPEVTAPADKPAKRKWWQKKDPNEITETPLDPIAGAAAAIEAAEPTAAETTHAKKEQVTAAAAAATAPTVALTKPFVQVGTFGVEANAEAAAAKVRRNGMTAQVRELKTEDNTVWRVLVGPAENRAQRRAILDDVKDLGFKDAFTAKN